MKKQVVMLILVIALVALVGVQAYQVSDLKSDIEDGTLSINPSGPTSRTQSVSSQRSAPTMVGGC